MPNITACRDRCKALAAQGSHKKKLARAELKKIACGHKLSYCTFKKNKLSDARDSIVEICREINIFDDLALREQLAFEEASSLN